MLTDQQKKLIEQLRVLEVELDRQIRSLRDVFNKWRKDNFNYKVAVIDKSNGKKIKELKQKKLQERYVLSVKELHAAGAEIEGTVRKIMKRSFNFNSEVKRTSNV